MEYVWPTWDNPAPKEEGEGREGEGDKEAAESTKQEEADHKNKTIKKLREKVEELEERVRQLEEENKRLREKEGEEDVLFQIDTDPTEEGKGSEGTIRYESRSERAMTEPGPGEEKSRSSSPGRPKGPGNTCFNCGGDHMIADCSQPKNYAVIAKRRREFQKASAAAASSNRYHLDEPQRFAHLKPGGIPSERLKKAMGLREDQLAPYVYRMRELGYPPGWLREAEVRHSGVALYLADGRSLEDVGEEEGEAREEEEKVRYNADKLVAWPGFNAPMPEKCRDDARGNGRGCPPPMKRQQSLDAMLEELGDRMHTGYSRGEMQDTTSSSPPPSSSKVAKYDEVVGAEGVQPRKRRLSPGGEGREEGEPAEKQLSGALRSDEVQMVNEGTPIVTRYSPYGSLPSQQAWAKDTTDHILFENLPDSTGKWDDMLKVIKRGREVRKRMQEEVEGKVQEKISDAAEQMENESVV